MPRHAAVQNLLLQGGGFVGAVGTAPHGTAEGQALLLPLGRTVYLNRDNRKAELNTLLWQANWPAKSIRLLAPLAQGWRGERRLANCGHHKQRE